MNLKTTFDDYHLPKGFQAAGLSVGIKPPPKKDLALVVSEFPAAVAGVFTSNQVKAASVKLCMERIQGGKGRAVVVNSGNANACTGQRGIADARKMGAVVADILGIPEEEVFVCSTGHIGHYLPMDVIEPGIHKVVSAVRASGGSEAAEAIMTTDTRPKTCVAEIEIDGQPVTISGMAKGAGMIHPNMATMLCFVLTDASVDAAALQPAVKSAADRSFNRCSVDADRSTNDTLLVFANGAAGNESLTPAHPAWGTFIDALYSVCFDLALKIVSDGEGSTKQVTVEVKGAATDEDADIAARSVANSIEVRANWHGSEPDWGRVMHALGYSKAQVIEEKVDIDFGKVPTVRNGESAGAESEALKKVFERETFTIMINMNQGSGEAVVYSCDASEEYIRLNVH